MATAMFVILLLVATTAVKADTTTVEPLSRDPCRNFRCENGGRCIAPADAPYCLCLTGFTGNRCQNKVPAETTTLPVTQNCTSMCDFGLKCRYVVTCKTCGIEPRCVPTRYITTDTDSICRGQGYSQAILLEDKDYNYSQLKVPRPSPLRNCKCPSGSDCVNDFYGQASCCRDKVAVPPGPKPGKCPTSSNLGAGMYCENDHQCPGNEKCCNGYTQMCAKPVNSGSEGLCEDRRCPIDQVCVLKQRSCTLPVVCLPLLLPTCVPRGCANCTANENCRVSIFGKYRCVPVVKEDECGGCPAGYVCKPTGYTCFPWPCPKYSCVQENKCGGCSKGQTCKEKRNPCSTGSCSSYNCHDED